MAPDDLPDVSLWLKRHPTYMGRMRIRNAEAADLPAIRKIHDAAFGGPAEGRLVAALTADGLDAISLLARLDDMAVGHILFSPLTVEVDGRPIRALALAPVGVDPAYQKRGIGTALIEAGLDQAKAAGWEAVVVLGHPGYYPRFGFRAALAAGFTAPFHGDAFMALELRQNALSGRKGRIIYPVSFGIDEAEAMPAAG